MSRALVLIAALAGALALAFLASQPPAALGPDAPATGFSAARAMADVREIARAPHPTGSADNARVRAYLVGRLRALGLDVQETPFALTPQVRDELRLWGAADATTGVNIVGLLRGADPGAPAVLLMAHHDTVAGSPGAADDGAGVAAILETLRALRTGPPLRRDLVVLFSDAEEPGLAGARAFFAADPQASRIGMVLNLEARGGGGRALMFETGPGNGQAAAVYARAVQHPSAHSLAVLMYRLMPNSTDFTPALAEGTPGYNFAFMGRAGLYHSPLSTAQTLDPRSVQHLGGQTLDLTRALAQAPALPTAGEDAVFSDLLGRLLIHYPPAIGWALIALSAGLVGFTVIRSRADWRESLGGGARLLAFLLHAVLALEFANRLSGAGRGADYYDRLAALPRLEVQALLICLAVLFAAWGLARPRLRGLAAVPALALTAGSVLLSGVVAPMMLGLGLAAAFLATFGPARAPLGAAGWIGALAPVLVLRVGIQVAAPIAAPLFAWPLLAASAAAAAAVGLDRQLQRPVALWIITPFAVIAGAQVLSMAHLAFLGVGAELAFAMAVFAMLVAILIWPLGAQVRPRWLLAAALVLSISAAGVALSVRLDPPAASMPVWRR